MVKVFRYILPVSFVILIQISGCKDDIPEGQGKAFAKKNGDEWEAVVYYNSNYAGNKDTVDIYFSRYTKEGLV